MSAALTLSERAAAKLDTMARKPRKGEPARTPLAVRLVTADLIKLEPVRWLWHEYVPLGMLTLLAGSPGCGKTTIAIALAATLTMADGRWPNGSRCTTPGRVVIWSAEDAASVLAARLNAAGADMKRVSFVGPMGDEDEARDFDPAHDWPALEAAIEALDDVRLVIVDPIVSAVAGDGHKSNEVRRALQGIVSFAQRKGCAVIGITHLSKGTAGADPVERVTGSIAFGAIARMVMIAAKQGDRDGEEQPRVLLRAKCNVGPDVGGFEYTLHRKLVAPDVEGQYVAWGRSIDGSARDILAEAEAPPVARDDEAGHATSALDDAMLTLFELLRAGALPAKTVYAEAQAAGHAKRTIERAKNELSVASFKEGEEWRWRMPAPGKNANIAKIANIAKAARLERDGDVPGLPARDAEDRQVLHPGDVGDVGGLGDVGDVETADAGEIE